MLPEEQKALLDAVAELEAWAGGLLSKCAHTRRLIEATGGVSTLPTQQPRANTAELAALSAKFRKRLTRKSK